MGDNFPVREVGGSNRIECLKREVTMANGFPMQAVLTLVAGALFAGCQPQFEGEFRHRSVLQRSTQGLVLLDDGSAGHAGMLGTNCPFETDYGMVTGDYDLPGEDEEVQDIGRHVLGANSILLVQDHAVHILNKNDGDYAVESLDVSQVIGGRFFDGGVVTVSGGDAGCLVDWFGDQGDGLQVETAGCDAFDVDPIDGTTYIDTVEGGVRIVTPSGSVDTPVSGDLLAWDAVSEVTYVASLGGDTVDALTPEGEVRWRTTLSGSIQVLEAAGRRGAAVVMLERPDESGLLVYLDGWTGDELSRLETPSAAKGVSVAGNGGSIALVLDDETHFYGVYLD